MLTLMDLPLNVENTLGKLKYGGVNGDFISLSAEKVLGNHLITVKKQDNFNPADFNFMEEVRLINAEITSSGIGRDTDANSGVLTGKLVKADSDEKSRWADEVTGGSDIMLTFADNDYEIPVNQYIGQELQFIGVKTGFSQAKSNERRQAARTGEDVDAIKEDVVKLSVHDKQKNETVVVDMPLPLLNQIENDFVMGDDIKLTELRIRFFKPDVRNWSHLVSATNVQKADTKGTTPNKPETKQDAKKN
ncbi:hypothetical protein ACRHK7_06570 [Weissella tructae]|uniref:hypothetical protein n=1 Tax=Weissella tructae TaxID=887702 RepID=UPI003D8D292A